MVIVGERDEEKKPSEMITGSSVQHRLCIHSLCFFPYVVNSSLTFYRRRLVENTIGEQVVITRLFSLREITLERDRNEPRLTIPIQHQ